MAWKRSGVRFSLAPRKTPGQRPGVVSFFGPRGSGGLRSGLRRLNSPVGHELFELVDREPHAPADPNRNQLLAPDELIERRSTQGQNLRGLDHVDEQRPGRGWLRVGLPCFTGRAGEICHDCVKAPSTRERNNSWADIRIHPCGGHRQVLAAGQFVTESQGCCALSLRRVHHVPKMRWQLRRGCSVISSSICAPTLGVRWHVGSLRRRPARLPRPTARLRSSAKSVATSGTRRRGEGGVRAHSCTSAQQFGEPGFLPAVMRGAVVWGTHAVEECRFQADAWNDSYRT
jgi:hypothetical protein